MPKRIAPFRNLNKATAKAARKLLIKGVSKHMLAKITYIPLTLIEQGDDEN